MKKYSDPETPDAEFNPAGWTRWAPNAREDAITTNAFFRGMAYGCLLNFILLTIAGGACTYLGMR